MKKRKIKGKTENTFSEAIFGSLNDKTNFFQHPHLEYETKIPQLINVGG